MKKGIHPKYNKNIKVTCACGNVFDSGSTLEEIKVDICSACHPFFTGKMKFIDTMGRVEKFQKKQKQAKDNKYTKKVDRKRLDERVDKAKPRTLKEMIEQQKKKTSKQ